jgi:hypothetical protein
MLRVLSLRTLDAEVRAAYGLSEIPQLYADVRHLVVAACNLMGTDEPERRLLLGPIRYLGYGLPRAPFLGGWVNRS